MSKVTYAFVLHDLTLFRADNYHINPAKIEEEILRGTSVILTSNPRNPTGMMMPMDELAQIQNICRNRATLIMVGNFFSRVKLQLTCPSG